MGEWILGTLRAPGEIDPAFVCALEADRASQPLPQERDAL